MITLTLVLAIGFFFEAIYIFILRSELSKTNKELAEKEKEARFFEILEHNQNEAVKRFSVEFRKFEDLPMIRCQACGNWKPKNGEVIYSHTCNVP